MPFTFSHPAIVLPLTFLDKKRYSVTALTVGSITPDFEYFLNFEQHSVYSHTWLGILWFDLPIAIILFFLFNRFVKDELIDHLPLFLRSRFERFKNLKRIKYTKDKLLIILTSLLIGITSHLFWDKLTHRTVALLVEEPMDFYPFFWDASSVIGAAAIAFMTWKMPKSNVTITRGGFFFWFLLLLTILVVVVIRSAYSTEIRNMGVSAISGLFIGLLVSSIINKWLPKKKVENN